MTVAIDPAKRWTADEFMVTDQSLFGDGWRYELVDGRIVGHAAPSPEHGAIVAGLAGALVRLRSRLPEGCRPEAGSAAAPVSVQRNSARIPDVMVRCGEHPRVMFAVISPSEMRGWRGRDLKRQHLQAVRGIREIIELSQDDYAAHSFRLLPGGVWTFEAMSGPDAELRLDSIGIEIPLAEIYQFADIAQPDQAGTPA